MTVLMFVLLFPAIQVAAAVPCPEDRGATRPSPCTAYPDEQEKIMKHINAGMDAHAKFRDAVKEEERWRALGKTRKLSFAESELWEKAERDRQGWESEMNSSLNYAIESTLRQYGLYPKYSMGYIVNGPLRGELTASLDSPWREKQNPKFLYAEKDARGRYKPVYRKVIREDGTSHYVKTQFEEDIQAITNENGTINVNVEAFQRAMDKGSPRLLARTLYHELAHYDGLVKRGWTSAEEEEYRAWTAAVKAMDVFDLTGTEREESMQILDEAAQARDLVRSGRMKPTDPFPNADQQREWKKDFEWDQSKLDEIKRQRDVLRTGIERSRLEREEAELRRQEEERQRRGGGDRPAISMLTADDIKGLVTAACGDTPGLVETHLARMRDKQWFAEDDGYKAGMENGMDGCSRELWDMFMRIRARIIEKGNIPVIDPTWFDDWFLKTARKAYAYHHPPPLGMAAFMVFAKKACARPGSVTQEDILDLEDMSFPNPRMWLSSSDSFPPHVWPNACPKVLYDDLAQLNNTQPRGWRLNATWVNWRAEQLVRQYAPPEAPRPSPQQPQGPEPEQRNDRIDVPTLDDIIRRIERK